MTRYNVHIYREMKLRFDGIEAASPEAAANIARNRLTDDADDIDDCDGETFAALVDVVGDQDFTRSRFIDFDPLGDAAERAIVVITVMGGLVQDVHSTKSVIVYVEDWDCPPDKPLGDGLRVRAADPGPTGPHRAAPGSNRKAERKTAMTHSLAAIDPFYAACISMANSPTPADPSQPIYVRLPRAPRTASPVPHLTSLYHFHRAGEYGDRKWPGNCGGNLIKDLLRYFKPGLILDPMSGSGTCLDVCDELGIPCMAWDIHRGLDACDPQGFGADTFDFIWAHPPYWRQKLYAEDPRDLSRSPTLVHFLRRYGQFIRNCTRSLNAGGKLAILMGDYSDREAGFVPLVYHTKRLAFEAGLRQHCTDIIRFSHGASSSKKVYRSSFIPGLHDVCMIFEKKS